MAIQTPLVYASLETINLAKLQAKDPKEIQRLLEVSSATGAFFLDYRDVQTEAAKHLPEDVREIIDISDRYFAQPLEVKMKDFREGQAPDHDRGFKQESECEDTFEISWDELEDGTNRFPPVLDQQAVRLDRLMRLTQSACRTMLSCLSGALGLAEGAPPEQRLEHFHRVGETSESGLKLIYEPTFARVADWFDNTHTDSGTFTVLYYDQLGLDVFDPTRQAWGYARVPEPGCAFVNLANALQRLSGGRLHSPLHRVSQPDDGFKRRFYLSYFLRPEHAVKKAWALEKA